MCDEECSDNVHIIAQWLWYSLRLCASTWVVSLKVTLISGSIGHCMVGIPEGHFLPLFWPGVLKGVIFELFGLFCNEIILKMVCCCDRFASNLSHLWPCSLLSLTSVAQGIFYVPWWTLLYCIPWWTLYCGSLSWRSLLYLWGTFWMPGITAALGLLAVGLSAAGVGSHQCVSHSRLVLLLLFWNKTWDIF